MIEYEIFILALSLQMAGSLLLLIFFLSAKRANVIKRFCGKGLIKLDGNTKKLQYDHEAFKSEYFKAYINKSSFFCLLLGYVLSVFGDKGSLYKDGITVFYVIVITAIIISGLYAVTRLICNKFISEITKQELDNLNIEPDIESASYEDIDDMFN